MPRTPNMRHVHHLHPRIRHMNRLLVHLNLELRPRLASVHSYPSRDAGDLDTSGGDDIAEADVGLEHVFVEAFGCGGETVLAVGSAAGGNVEVVGEDDGHSLVYPA